MPPHIALLDTAAVQVAVGTAVLWLLLLLGSVLVHDEDGQAGLVAAANMALVVLTVVSLLAVAAEHAIMR